jgi:DNA-binding SARP family transcriptional activator
MARGEPQASLSSADEAIGLLSATSAGMELIAARLARAYALAYLGDLARSRVEMATANQTAKPGQGLEVALEIANIEALFGETGPAQALLGNVAEDVVETTDIGAQALLARAFLRVREGDLSGAWADVARLQPGQPRTATAFEARRRLVGGLVLALARNPEASGSIRDGTALSTSQGANLWARYGLSLATLADRSRDPSRSVVELAQDGAEVLSMLAEAVLSRLAELDEAAIAEVYKEAERRPWRWRESTRRMLTVEDAGDREAAARLLVRIGETQDVKRLRDAGRRLRDRQGPRLGYDLARRLADRVLVEDLGRVRIRAGKRTIEGGEVRRKVLALLCLLLSKQRFASTREEVLDSLWPEHDPTSALNSLNQTVYFLRRVFEPEYSDDTSPGYLGQDGETIWLDPELVDSHSRRCLEIIRSMPGDPTPEGSIALAAEYRGRFALDFAYEEWAVPYRDSLHASYLRVMEQAIRMDLDSGHFVRGTFLAERAAEVDPDSEEIQIALVRLYRLSGAHAAAAEQYAHYAQVMRDLGVDPIALADL